MSGKSKLQEAWKELHFKQNAEVVFLHLINSTKLSILSYFGLVFKYRGFVSKMRINIF